MALRLLASVRFRNPEPSGSLPLSSWRSGKLVDYLVCLDLGETELGCRVGLPNTQGALNPKPFYNRMSLLFVIDRGSQKGWE